MSGNWIKLEDSKICVEALFAAINSQFGFDQNGQIFGTNFHLNDDCTAAFEPFIAFNQDIPDELKFEVLSTAVWNAAKQKELNYDNFLPHFKKSQSEYLSKPKQQFTVITSLSIKFFKELNFKRKNLSIKFSARPPKIEKYKEYIAGFSDLTSIEIPEDYTCVAIKVNARNEFEAYHSAIKELDYLRSIWNWKYEPTRRIFPGTLNGYPMNFFTLGPIHVLIKPDQSFGETVWHEPEYKYRINDIREDWNELKKFEQKSRRAISTHPYGGEITDALCKFVQALDHPELKTSFLQLWQVLELITGTEYAKYQLLVDKVVFLQKDPLNLHRAFLQNLRRQRNSTIHDGKKAEKIENYLIQLKGYVKSVFAYHIQNPFKSEKMKDSVSYLEMSPDKNYLEAEIKKYKKVLNFLLR